MNPLASLLEEETAASRERQSLILLRWMLILASAALLLASHLYDPVAAADVAMIVAFAASNIALYVFWEWLSQQRGFDTYLAVIDTLFLSLAISVCGIAPSELFVLSVLVVFLVSFGKTLRQIVPAAAAVGILYIWLTAQLRPEGMVLHPAFLIRIPFLYSVAIYFGYFAARVHSERRASEHARREREELRILMDILETVNSTLDLRGVMRAITTKISEAVKAERCSVLLIDTSDSGLVLASSDKPDVDRLEIDLSRYPEVKRAIELREPVLIQDVQNHPLMREVRHLLATAGFNSILVVPMIHGDDIVGTLLLRAASVQTQFSPRVVAFCQAIASASANALKNALLYRQVKDESSRHRATIEKLQNILAHSMDLIVTTDLEGLITDFNRTAEEVLGYKRGEIVGRPLTEIYRGAGDRAQFLSVLRMKGELHQRDASLRARDGSGRTLDLTVSVVRNDLNEVVGSVCVGKALTGALFARAL